MWKKIYNAAFSHELNLKIKSKDLKKRIYNLNSDINYLYSDNKIVGFAMLFPLYKNIWHLDYFAIDPNHQSMGYGKLLMNQILKKYKFISLECEDNLVPYYKKFNFKKFNIDYDYNGTKLNILLNIPNLLNNKISLLVNKLNNYNLLNLILLISLNHTFEKIIKKLSNDSLLIEGNYYKHEIF
jgi:GNAT superfamily N-acetyltransferase